MSEPSHSHRVLVVDDFELVRKIHVKNLTKMGFIHIDQCVNGAEALVAASKQSYDLILLDWYMPEMDGKEALIELRAKGYTMPIVMCTDESEAQSVRQALQNGATAYITKPYAPDQFAQTIRSVLK